MVFIGFNSYATKIIACILKIIAYNPKIIAYNPKIIAYNPKIIMFVLEIIPQKYLNYINISIVSLLSSIPHLGQVGCWLFKHPKGSGYGIYRV